jgi:hypothetical protein
MVRTTVVVMVALETMVVVAGVVIVESEESGVGVEAVVTAEVVGGMEKAVVSKTMMVIDA